MEKPVKRVLMRGSVYLQYDKGYNHSWDDRETWLKASLPRVEEIAKTMFLANDPNGDWDRIKEIHKEMYYREATAISALYEERLGGEK